MQATSAQSVPNQQAGLTGLILALIFGAGAALGVVTGIAMAPGAASIAATQSAADVYAGPYLGRGGVNGPVVIKDTGVEFNALRIQRAGEIGRGDLALPLRIQRVGEINAGTAPGGASTSALPRYEVTRGK